MNYIIFEDNNIKNLYPFTINHASFEVRIGGYCNFDRIVQSIEDSDTLQIIVRPEIHSLVKMRFPDYDVNPKIVKPGVLLNGAIIWDKSKINQYRNSSDVFQLTKNQKIEEIDFMCHNLQVKSDYISFLWDAIKIQENFIIEDCKKNSSNWNKSDYEHIQCIDEKNIWISDAVQINPGVVLDASEGPIMIGKNSIIDSNTVIKGPVFIEEGCYIAPQTLLNKNVSLGPFCKVGGEITNTIFHGYSNKVHYGFLGHSYICEWVNLGAGTTTSNLKNNYSNVKFNFKNKIIDSNEQFLGSLVGDYSRTSIGTLINSGTYIGMAANIFDSNFSQKFHSSFSWGNDGKVRIEELLQTIIHMQKRRNKTFSDIEKDFLLRCDATDEI